MIHAKICLLLLVVAVSLNAQDSAMVHIASAVKAAEQHQFEEAVTQLTKAIDGGVKNPEVFYRRGRWNFQAGKAKASVEDFDAYLEKVPSRLKSLWERGISCYYAGDFKAGAEQFVKYQTYHDSDVENAVWRYLCQLPTDGKVKARKDMLPIKGDSRIPMMEVYQLFKGELSPEEVLKALTESTSDETMKKTEAMHAHLYLGLYYDTEKQPKKAKEHIDLSVKQFEKGSYMWSVAVVHREHLKKARKKSE